MSGRRPEDFAALLLRRLACRWNRRDFPEGIEADTEEDGQKVMRWTSDAPDLRDEDDGTFTLGHRDGDPLSSRIVGSFDDGGTSLLDGDFPRFAHAFGQVSEDTRHSVRLSGTNEFASESTGLYGMNSQGGMVQYIKGQAFVRVSSRVAGEWLDADNTRKTTMTSVVFCRRAIAEINRIVVASMNWFQMHGYHYCTYMAHDKVPVQDISGFRERSEPIEEGYTVRIAYGFFMTEGTEEVALMASFGGKLPMFGSETPVFSEREVSNG